MIEITDINDQRISLYKTLKKAKIEHFSQNVFISEGKKICECLLDSDLKIISFFCIEHELAMYYEKLLQKGLNSDQIYFADIDLMNKIVGFRLHSGILAIAEIPKESRISDLAAPLVLLNGIVDSENVGAIARNCAAFNIKSIITDDKTSSPWLRRAVRVSMGAIFGLDYRAGKNLVAEIKQLKLKNIQIIAAEVANNAISINECKLPKNCAVIFGSEGRGIDSEILALCDFIVEIPISQKVASLNVAATSAIILNRIKP
ncbi:MAG: RNA methyltransferase [Candidatus Kapabacteria bacterium]|nr:RNA methyltransferase [Candidatus Kapabacteria bacterium]